MRKSRAAKPTLQQKKDMSGAGLNPRDWLVRGEYPNSLILVHKSTGTTRVVET